MQAARLQGVLTASVFAVLSLALGGASCGNKSAAKPNDPGPNVPFQEPPGGGPAKKTPATPAAPAAPAAPAPAPKPAAATPAAGGHVAELLEKLPSPCGKAMSLKKTLDADPGCKQGPFAKRFVERLASFELTDDQIGEIYRKRYGAHESYTFDLRDTPFIGSPNAPVVLVEFYDYGCPHCRDALPILEQEVDQHPKDVVLYFKLYPLRKETMEAAKASVAAFRQGKFKEMHQTLFAHQGAQSKDDVMGYAKELGLDMVKFEKDLNDPATEAKVMANKDEGTKAHLEGTPTLYLNGHQFVDMLTLDSLNDWIEEEVAVNR
jgi:protein-disulfide isomerase